MCSHASTLTTTGRFSARRKNETRREGQHNDNDRSGRRHADQTAQLEFGVSRHRVDAAQQAQVAHCRNFKEEGYISAWDVTDAEVGKTLTLSLKFGPNRERSIVGIKRVSKPGLRVYTRSTAIPQVFGGLGVAILSTSSGLLTDRQAEKKGVGGEVLAYVW